VVVWFDAAIEKRFAVDTRELANQAGVSQHAKV
jgi:hypothetical protein